MTEEIKQFSLSFAQKITKAILSENYEEVDELIEKSNEYRDNLELREDVERDKSFYYGYLYAYENIASRMLDNNKEIAELEELMQENELASEAFCLIGKEEVIEEGELISRLGVEIDELNNLLENINIGVVSKHNLGSKKAYSLSAKGRSYFYKKKTL